MRYRSIVCFIVGFSCVVSVNEAARAKTPETKVIMSDLYAQSGAASKLYELKPEAGWYILPGTSSVEVVESSGKPSYAVVHDDGGVITYRVNTMVTLHGFLPSSSSIKFKIKAIEYR